MTNLTAIACVSHEKQIVPPLSYFVNPIFDKKLFFYLFPPLFSFVKIDKNP